MQIAVLLRLTSRLILVLTGLAIVAGVGVGCGDDAGDLPPTSPAATTALPTGPGSQTARPTTSLDLPVRVAVTLPIFEDLARQAAGDHGEVFSLVPQGADPRTYELTEDDLARLEGVLFFFVNGRGLDAHLEEAIEEHRDEEAFVIPFAPNVASPTVSGLTAEEAMDEAHLWLDPDLAAIYIAIVADEFVIYDGVNRAFYADNLNVASAQLEALKDELIAEVESLPVEQRRMLVSSEAATHLARFLGLEVLGTADLGEGETGEQATQRLIQIVNDQSVPGVFAEYGHDDSVIEAVASATGVPVCMLHTDVASADLLNYEAMMRWNVSEILRCLG
jgi:ABC-type Zn uptake system ZnuABC Zn-binding protein ZnuA